MNDPCKVIAVNLPSDTDTADVLRRLRCSNIFCSFNVDTKNITLFDEKQLAKQSFHIIIEFCLTSHSCNTSKILSLEEKNPISRIFQYTFHIMKVAAYLSNSPKGVILHFLGQARVELTCYGYHTHTLCITKRSCLIRPLEQ